MGSHPHSRRRRWTWLAVAASAALAIGLVGVTPVAQAATTFSANFEDGTTNAWSKSGGTWTVVTDGTLALQQSKAGTDNARVFAGDAGWAGYTVQARVKPLSLGSGGFVGLLARAKTSTTFYRLALMPGNLVQLQTVNSGAVTVLASSSRTVSTGTWYTLALTTNGPTISGSVDGTTIGTAISSVITSGRIGLQTGRSTANFDDVTVNMTAGARSADDKVFQHNGSGTVHITGFYAKTIGKLYRACGNCTVSHERRVVVDNVLLDGAKYVVGININWGDTATLTHINLINGTGTHICAEYNGVAKGSEPPYLGDGVNDGHCLFTAANVTYL